MTQILNVPMPADKVIKIIRKTDTVNKKRVRYLNKEQLADYFARKNIVDDEDFMFDMGYYNCDPYTLGKAHRLPVQQAVLKMCDINFGSTECRYDPKIVQLREKMLTAYELSDYINIYNTR